MDNNIRACMNKVLTIIVSYNGMEWIDKCLSSIKTSTIASDVIVIDNGSTDGTIRYVQTTFPEYILIQNEKNIGFGQANNVGFQYALNNGYEYVYLLNQDAWVFSDTMKNILSVFEKNAEYGILSPFQVEAKSKRIDQNFQKEVCSYNSNKDLMNDFYWGMKRDVYPVSKVMAAHWMIKVSVIGKIGGFSPTFHHYGEDYDYIQRVKFFGFSVGVVPSSIAVHDRGNRIVSKEKKMYLDYTSLLIGLSSMINPTNLYIVLYHSIKQSIQNKSFKPLFYFVSICRNFRTIIKNREIALAGNAFLDI